MKRVILGLMVGGLLSVGVNSAYCWSWEKKKEPARVPVEKVAPTAKAVVVAPSAEVAAESKEAKIEEAPAVKPVVLPEPVNEAPKYSKSDIDRMRVAREKKKEALNNTQWDIVVSSLSGKGSSQKDTLIFKENKFLSENFNKLGFGASNFTLTVEDAGSSVVETMQSSEKEGMVFWRVEVDAPVAIVKGVISRQLSGNKTEDFSFTSTAKKPVLVNQAPAEEKK